MSRLTAVVLLVAACSKSAGSKEKPDETPDRIAVPGAQGAPTKGAPVAGDDKRFRLSPEEGKLAVEVPAAKAGSEAVAKIVITPGSAYYVNTEFPTKLSLEPAEGVTVAKAELTAGGQDNAKGDAEVFEKAGLAFAVKLTPNKPGRTTINGTFKFAVCDKAGSTCLAKKEPVAIQVAAD